MGAEEVAERSVSDVMKQTGDSHRLFDELWRGHVPTRHLQRRVEMTRPLAGEMHRAESVLKP